MAIDWDRLFGSEQPQGYYDRIQKSYQIPKVERLEKANGECQRITKLNARSFIGVRFLEKLNQKVINSSFQWVACGAGVIASAATVFSLMAIWKQNEKFDKEILTPVKNYLRKTS